MTKRHEVALNELQERQQQLQATTLKTHREYIEDAQKENNKHGHSDTHKHELPEAYNKRQSSYTDVANIKIVDTNAKKGTWHCNADTE